MAAAEFVKGWLLLDTLGEGRFGEVKLLMNQESHEMVAVKVLVIKSDEMAKQVKKEICIHKNLQHKNIISFYGNRHDEDSHIEYLFLEYAQNGELFEQIEPDIGMDKLKAFRYFSELLFGLEYLHQRGIAHRDIKPENILLDAHNQVKISDFGMATLFRYQGQERLLNQLCGSTPYIAPEVILNKPHHAEPMDIWSCGIVLLAMLTGELPWSKAERENELFGRWLKGKFNLHDGVWSKIDTITIAFFKSILEPNPSKRITLNRIRNHRAFILNTGHDQRRAKSYNHHILSKRQCLNYGGFSSQPQPDLDDHLSSSPFNKRKINDVSLMEVDHMDDHLSDDAQPANWTSFSQPNRIQDMFISTQTQMELDSRCSQGSHRVTPPETRLFLQFVPRFTRFFSRENFATTVEYLESSFDDLNWPWKRQSIGQIFEYKISMTDQNRIPLVFRSFINEMSANKILVDFRMSKGDGIEFKRKFLQIKTLLKPIIKPFQSDEILRNIS